MFMVKSEPGKLRKLAVVRIWLFFSKFLPKSHIGRAPLTGGVAKQSARISNNSHNLVAVNKNKKFADACSS